MSVVRGPPPYTMVVHLSPWDLHCAAAPLKAALSVCAGWSEYSECSHLCAPAGNMVRQFDVSVPAAAGGAQCMGNIAVGKWSSASTEAHGGVASRGNDGNTNGNYGAGSCTHTASGGASSWWQVDLAGDYNISSVEIYHRSGMCGPNPCAQRASPSAFRQTLVATLTRRRRHKMSMLDSLVPRVSSGAW